MSLLRPRENRRRSLGAMQMGRGSHLIAFVKSGVARRRMGGRGRAERSQVHPVSSVTSQMTSPPLLSVGRAPLSVPPRRGRRVVPAHSWGFRGRCNWSGEGLDSSFCRPCGTDVGSGRLDEGGGNTPKRSDLLARRGTRVGSSFPLRKQLVFMFLQMISKFSNPGNKRSFVQRARSLERGDSAVLPPTRPLPASSPGAALPRTRVSVRLAGGGFGAGGYERLSVCIGAVGE